jgi:hypothetical protein
MSRSYTSSPPSAFVACNGTALTLTLTTASPLSRVLVDKLSVAQIIKFTALYKKRRFVAAFTRTHIVLKIINCYNYSTTLGISPLE